jgi:acetate kinase
MNVLTVNAGSSSLRFALHRFDESGADTLLIKGSVEQLGSARGSLRLTRPGESPREQTIPADPPATVLRQVIGQLGVSADELHAVGCRVVHGGAHFRTPVVVTAAVLKEICVLDALAPLHNASTVDLIETVWSALPRVPVMAVFDTAFHRTLPAVASTYALPTELCDRLGLRRYGFHGIAYQAVTHRLLAGLGRPAAGTRLVLCHLGSGASVCAVRDGQSIDTSMGFTPLEGLVMGTRSGDVDAGLVLYLQRVAGFDADAVGDLLNHRSGLHGLSGGRSADVRELLAAADRGDAHAELALEVFAYRAAKYIGAYAVALAGLDAVAFSGGIGEHSAPMRARICRRLGFLGLHLDEAGNAAADGSAAISVGRTGSAIAVWVVPAEENLQIAREVHAALSAQPT